MDVLEIVWCDMPGWCILGMSLVSVLLWLCGVTFVFSGVRSRQARNLLVRGALCNSRNVETGVNIDDNDSLVVRRGDEGSDQ